VEAEFNSIIDFCFYICHLQEKHALGSGTPLL